MRIDLTENRFTDFNPTYIEDLAKKNGMRYTTQTTSTDIESSLYNNEKTNTTEIFKLEMTIDGLHCEYYTAVYSPMALSDEQITNMPAESEQLIDPVKNPFKIQVFSITLPYDVESIFVESRTSISLNNILGISSVIFKSGKRVNLETDFNQFFRVHIPTDGEIIAFTILAPNIMLRLLEKGGNYNFEFAKNKIYFYLMPSQGVYLAGEIALKKADYDALMEFGIESARTMARAARPTKSLSNKKPQAMWEIFGTTNKKARLYTRLVLGLIITIMAIIVMPPLWPLIIPIAIFFYIRYQLLVSRRSRLLSKYADKTYDGDIVKSLKKI